MRVREAAHNAPFGAQYPITSSIRFEAKYPKAGSEETL